MHCADSRSARLTAASTPECEDHFTQRKPMRVVNGPKPPGLQIHAPKSCANHAAGSRLHVPQIKRRYTHRGWTQAAVRTAGSTILRAAHPGKSGGPAHGPWHGPPAPARKSKSTVRRGARGRRIFYAVAGAVACSVQSRGCPHVLTLVSRHARFSHVRSRPGVVSMWSSIYESNATYRPRL